jgi:thiol-disulfide isomerase/thioredoxin
MGVIARYTIIFILLFSIFLVYLQPVKSDDSKIVLQYFYNETCLACNETKPIINGIEQYYGDKITIQRYQVEDNPETENYKKWRNYYEFQYLPSVVVLNLSSGSYTKFPYGQIDEEQIKITIEKYIAGENSETSEDQNKSINIYFIAGAVVVIIGIVLYILVKKVKDRKK